MVPRRGCPLFTDLTSIFVPRVFETQAELRSQERAHALIAIWVPFNQKITHRSRNAACPCRCHGRWPEAKAPAPMSAFEESHPKPVVLPPRGHSAMSRTSLAATALERGATGTGWAVARVPLIILQCPRRPHSRELPA